MRVMLDVIYSLRVPSSDALWKVCNANFGQMLSVFAVANKYDMIALQIFVEEEITARFRKTLLRLCAMPRGAQSVTLPGTLGQRLQSLNMERYVAGFLRCLFGNERNPVFDGLKQMAAKELNTHWGVRSEPEFLALFQVLPALRFELSRNVAERCEHCDPLFAWRRA